MGWQPAIDLTANSDAPSMFGKPASYPFYVQTIVYVGFTPGVGPNGHIFQLRWQNNEWHHKDLTDEASAPLAYSGVTAYPYYTGDSQHVVYLGQDGQGLFDNQVHELYAYQDNKWHAHNLTKAVPGGAPLALSDPTGYEFNDLQHVVYQGIDSHIYELWNDSNGWHVNDLTIGARKF